MIIYIYTSFAHIPLSSNTEAFFELCWNIHFSWTEVLLSFFQQSFRQKSPLIKCNPRSFTACPWKTMVGRLLSFWDGKSQGQTVKLLRSTLGRPPSPRWFDGKKRHPCLRVIFFLTPKNNQLMVSWCFGARWFVILGVPSSNNPFHRGIPGIQTTGPQTTKPYFPQHTCDVFFPLHRPTKKRTAFGGVFCFCWGCKSHHYSSCFCFMGVLGRKFDQKKARFPNYDMMTSKFFYSEIHFVSHSYLCTACIYMAYIYTLL